MITVIDRQLNIPQNEKFIGCLGDNLVEQRQFEVPAEYSDLIFKLDIQIDAHKGSIPLTKLDGTDNIWVWDIKEEQIPCSGLVSANLSAFDSQDMQKWNTISEPHFMVEKTVNADGEFAPLDPTGFRQIETHIANMKNDVIAKASEVEADIIAVEADKNLVVENTNTVTLLKEATDQNKTYTDTIKSDVEELKTDTEGIYSDCVGIKNVITGMISEIPTKYMKNSIESMNAITTMKHGDICEIINSELKFSSIYKYFDRDIQGNPLTTPTWAWMTDLSMVQLSKDYLMDILQLADVADSGSYTDLTNKPNRYESFITVTDGNWNYALSDKIILTTTNALNIIGLTNGAIGEIVTTFDIPLPANSIKSYDYGFITLTGSQKYFYTFQYDGINYYWHRTVMG